MCVCVCVYLCVGVCVYVRVLIHMKNCEYVMIISDRLASHSVAIFSDTINAITFKLHDGNFY